MKRLNLPVAFIGGVATASGESFLGTLHQLLLPRLYLVRMHLEAFCKFGQRAITADGGEDHLRLERRTVVLCVRLGMGLGGLIESEQGHNITP